MGVAGGPYLCRVLFDDKKYSIQLVNLCQFRQQTFQKRPLEMICNIFMKIPNFSAVKNGCGPYLCRILSDD